MSETSTPKVTSTSLGIPTMWESVIANLCLFSSIFIYFKEQANVYCRALALQNIIMFYILLCFFIFFLITTLNFGSWWEIVTLVYLGFWFVLKVVMIIIGVVFSKSEKYVGIPPLSTFILNKASAL